jgi:cytochrome c-type protein NapB
MRPLPIVLTSLTLLTAAGALAQEGTSPDDIGLRRTPLTGAGKKTEETKVKGGSPGTNKKLARSYETAPPMIPHAVQGFVPIGLRNQCLNCHTNPPKPYRSATVVPESHYVGRDGKPTPPAPSSVRKIYLGFYNCTMCHAPQQDAAPLVENTFKGD